MLKKIVLLVAVLGLFTGCKNNQEQNDLAAAQQCLDNVPESNPGQASNCMSYIQKYSDQQSDILKCSILDVSAGLTDNKMVQAYQILQDNTQTNKAASFMTTLSLNLPDLNTAYQTVKTADGYCQASGVTGLQYISGLVVAGTAMSYMMTNLNITLDLNNTASINSAVQTLINDCATTTTPPQSCIDQLQTIGTTVANVGTEYCSTKGADQTVCGQVNQALAAAGNNETNLGQALLCYMKNPPVAYDTTTGNCCPTATPCN